LLVASIAPPDSVPRAEPHDDTPADLPSELVSFRDALGRETALERRRARGEVDRASSESRGAKPAAPAAPHEQDMDAPAGEPDEETAALEAPIVALATAPPDAAPSPGGGVSPAGAALESGMAPADEPGAAPDQEGALPAAALAMEEPGGPDPALAKGLGKELRAPAAGMVAEGAASDVFVRALEFAADLDAAPGGSAAARDARAPADAAAAGELAFLAARDGPGEAARPPATAAPAALDDPARPAAGVERAVTLAELPRALEAEVDGFLRVRERGGRWEAEIRLDPPELGALHVRLELRGHVLHGVVRAEDARLEPALERLFAELEDDLRRQGAEASFDLSRGAQERDEGRARTPSAAARPRVPGVAAPRPAVGGAGPDADRLVDLLA
jgi:hypothetical protein